MRFVVVALFVALGTAPPGRALSTYRSLIPNGNTSTCRTCHVSVNGGNPWNDFGKDVLRQDPDVTEDDLAAASGQNRNYNQTPTWDANLCGADSDGDGQTNGQELGDPNCIWVHASPNPPFPRTSDISNPGDPASKSANPDGLDPPSEGEGEGEGDVGEGEGEGEGEGDVTPGGCPGCTSAGDAFPLAALAGVIGLLSRGRRSRRT